MSTFIKDEFIFKFNRKPSANAIINFKTSISTTFNVPFQNIHVTIIGKFILFEAPGLDLAIFGINPILDGIVVPLYPPKPKGPFVDTLFKNIEFDLGNMVTKKLSELID